MCLEDDDDIVFRLEGLLRNGFDDPPDRVDADAAQQAVQMIKSLTEDPEIGRIYRGKVKRIVNFGAFVEILPGRDGLIHISELDDRRVAKVEDVVKEGDLVLVKVIGVDDEGKIRLSRKAALPAVTGRV